MFQIKDRNQLNINPYNLFSMAFHTSFIKFILNYDAQVTIYYLFSKIIKIICIMCLINNCLFKRTNNSPLKEEVVLLCIDLCSLPHDFSTHVERKEQFVFLKDSSACIS